MRKHQHLVLTPTERVEAQAVLDRGTAPALTFRHARILLEGEERSGRRVRPDVRVAALCGVSARTVARVRARFARDGFAVALRGRPHPGAAPKLSSAQELQVVALAGSAPPAGHTRWSVRLLTGRVALEALPTISRELVRTTLKKAVSSRGGNGGG